MLENVVCGSLYPLGICAFQYDLRRRQSMIFRTGSMGSPFMAYDDGFQWTDVYTECDEMLESCILTYLLAELRSLKRASSGEASSKTEKQVLEIPLAAKDLMRIVNSSRQLLTSDAPSSPMKQAAAPVNISFNEELLKTADERSMRVKRTRPRKNIEPPKGEEEIAQSKPIISPTMYVAFDDNFDREELYYSIGVNHRRRRITVCFRGSVVSNVDWATDFNTYMKEAKNPMKMHSSQQPTMKIHSRLHDLLYASSSRNPLNKATGELCPVFMEILTQRIQPVTQNYPGYKLYMTGHSLGGAIATLFAFHAAAEPDSIIPKPVTCVSIASPYVGDESFRLAHQMLEGLGKLRHLRVSNHKDVVTASPKMSFRWSFYPVENGHVGSLFKHVGMNLRLYQNNQEQEVCSVTSSDYEISYPKVQNGFLIGNYFDEMARGWDQSPFANLSCNPVDFWTWPWHSIREYNYRLSERKGALQKIYLNDLYSRKEIVGNLGTQF